MSFAELPLTLFTTLAPLGAGAFVLLAIAFFTLKLNDQQLAKIDKLTLVPFLVTVAGFIAAAFHLASPAHAFGVFAGIGHSPLSNEVCVGVIFVIVALAYAVMAFAGKLGGARKGFSAVVALCAILFAGATGMAYVVPTIASWNTAALPVEIIGFSLLGGSALASILLAAASAAKGENLASLKKSALVVAAVGLVLGIIGIAVQTSLANGAANAAVDGASLVSAAISCIAVAVILMVAGLAILWRAYAKNPSVTMTTFATVVICCGIFAARLAFYATQISVGLSL